MNSDLENKLFLNSDTEQQVDTTWFQRTFKKMEHDSMRGAIFICLITALGTGIFTLHHLFNQIGVFFAIILIFAMIMIFSESMRFITAGFLNNPECKSLGELHLTILNRPLAVIYDALFCVYVLLVVIGIQASLGKVVYINFENLIWYLIPVESGNRNYLTFNNYFPVILGFLLFTMVVQKSVNALRHLSLFSFFIFILLAFICVFEMPGYYQQLKETGQDNFNMADMNMIGFFQTFGCLIFSFNVTNSYFAVVTTVQNPNKRRLNKIFSRTFMIIGLLAIVIGLASYLSLGINKTAQTDLFIFREAKGNDFIMYVGRCLLLVSFITAGAVNGHSLKNNLFEIFNIQGRGWAYQIGMTTLIIGISTITVIFSTSITYFVSFAGSFSGTMMVFIFPGLIAYKVGYYKSKLGKAWVIIFIALFGGFGLVSSYFSFINFFK